MSKEELDGVWRTVRGRRIFIKKGESLDEAMSRSGKFSRVEKNKDKYDIIEKSKKFDKGLKKTNKERYDIDKSHEKDKWEEQEKYKARHNTKEAQRYEKNEYKKVQEFKDKKQSNNKVETEYELYKRAKEHPETIDAMTENSVDWERLEQRFGKEAKNNVEKYLEKNKKQETFKQTSTNPFYEDREYNKEQLDKMAEQGIQPMKNSYSGRGWKGVNADKNLTTSEQAKAITDEMKKQFPDVKIARKSDVYSGGSSIDFNIMSSDKDLYISEKDIDSFGNEQLFNTDITRGWGFERWAKENVPSYREESSYSVDDVKRYAKEQLKNMKAHDNQNVRGNEWYLSDYGKKVVSALNKEANSYTFDDSDGSTDYFHHGTYMDINIGKWNKPYQVNDTKAKVDAFKKRKGK